MNIPAEIQVLLVENHKILRRELKNSLELNQSIKISAEAGSGETAVEVVSEINLDVVFMDINLPGMNGFETTRKILAIAPKLKVIAMSMHNDINYLIGMMEAGASGYMLKSSSGKSMGKAVETVLSEKYYFSTEILSLIHEYKDESSCLMLNQYLEKIE